MGDLTIRGKSLEEVNTLLTAPFDESEYSYIQTEADKRNGKKGKQYLPISAVMNRARTVIGSMWYTVTRTTSREDERWVEEDAVYYHEDVLLTIFADDRSIVTTLEGHADYRLERDKNGIYVNPDHAKRSARSRAEKDAWMQLFMERKENTKDEQSNTSTLQKGNTSTLQKVTVSVTVTQPLTLNNGAYVGTGNVEGSEYTLLISEADATALAKKYKVELSQFIACFKVGSTLKLKLKKDTKGYIILGVCK